MKKISIYIIALLHILASGGCFFISKNNDILSQVSTINALMEGVYDGFVPFSELNKHGDFGLGTFDGLDGEMIAIDGKFYQIKSDGMAYKVFEEAKTPFAVMTFFDSDIKLTVQNIESLEHLSKVVDILFPTRNIFYAIKVKGRFTSVKTRSVARQSKPYPGLAAALEKQTMREFQNVDGTLVGFWCPEYTKGINVPEYHFHFIDKNLSGGGHVLECRIETGSVEIDATTQFFMILPENEAFYKLDLRKLDKKSLNKAEKGYPKK